MLASLLFVTAMAATLRAHAYVIKPFSISLSSETARLHAQLQSSHLPSNPIVGADNEDFGIRLETLEALRNDWLVFDWTKAEERLNSYVYSLV